MKFYRFKRLIEKYVVSFTIEYPKNIVRSTDPADYDNLGNYIGSDAQNGLHQTSGALMPPNDRQIYNSGGKLTASDRLLYSFDHNIPEGSKLHYKSMVYHVHPRNNYEDVADFSVYECKAVNGFD